jgi:hypothetical protein
MPPKNGPSVAAVVRKLSDQPPPLQPPATPRCLCGASSCTSDWGLTAQIRDVAAGAIMATSACSGASMSLVPSFLVSALLELLAGQFPLAGAQYTDAVAANSKSSFGSSPFQSSVSSSAVSSELLRLLPTSRAVWQAALLGYDVVVTPLAAPPARSQGDLDDRTINVLLAVAEQQRFACCDMLHDALFPAVEVLHRCCSSSANNDCSSSTSIAAPAEDIFASPFAWGIGNNPPTATLPPQAVSSPPPETLVASVAASKVDQWLGILWSVAVHVTRQPMLERHCGPTAVLVCATPDQCDEVAWLLAPLANKLNLVVHNVCDPPPLMPEDRRADIVVATPLMMYHQFPIAPPFAGGGGGAPTGSEGDPIPILHSYVKVSALAGLQRAMGVPVPPFGGPNILQAAAASKKKYQLDMISQFAVMDAFGVLRTGQGPLVDAVMGSALGTNVNSAHNSPWACMFTRGIKHDAQFYVAGVCGAHSEVAAMRWLRLHREAKHVRFQDRLPMALVSVLPSSAKPPPPAADRKRPREEKDTRVVSETTATASAPSSTALVLRNCVSMAQLARDPEVLHDLLLAVQSSLPEEIAERHEWRATIGFVVATTAVPEGCRSGDDEAELVLLVQGTHDATKCTDEGTRGKDDERFRDALSSVATSMRGQVLEGNPVIAVLVPTAALTPTRRDHLDASGVFHDRLHVNVLAAARDTCPAPLFDIVHVVAPSTPSQRLNVWCLSLESLCGHEGGVALPRGGSSGAAPATSPNTTNTGVYGIDRVFPACTSAAHLTEVVHWLCASPAEAFTLWNGSILSSLSCCTITIRGFAGPHASIADVTSRPPRPAGVASADWPSRSVLEEVLTQCQTAGFVKSFLVHKDTSGEDLSLWIEYWTVAAAQVAFTLVQRMIVGDPSSNPSPLVSTAAAAVVEWASTSLFYEGVRIPASFHDDGFPHPLDR